MSIAGGVVHKTTTRKIRSTESKCTIDLVKVFDAIFTSRQTREKLQ